MGSAASNQRSACLVRKVVLLNDLDISDIISNSLYKEYVQLLKDDIAAFFSEKSSLIDVVCPACREKAGKDTYEKLGMAFKVCSSCGSHYVSPRPDRKALNNFYENSQACRFWRKKSLNLPDSKVYYIYGPRVHWMSGLVDEFISDEPVLLDVGTKYPHLIKHLFDEKIFGTINLADQKLFEYKSLLPAEASIINEPNECRGKVNVITAFETVERMVEPWEFFDLANKVCRQGGLLLLTMASCSGFEYQVLGCNAPNINPINRMNLLTIEALKKCIENAGFELIELSTPGRLDAEVVRQELNSSKDVEVNPFWKYFFTFRDKHAYSDLQTFLQVNLLSSHVRVAARKK